MTTPARKKAEEIWNSIERSRGVYHPNDKDAYLYAIAAALHSREWPSEDESERARWEHIQKTVRGESKSNSWDDCFHWLKQRMGYGE